MFQIPALRLIAGVVSRSSSVHAAVIKESMFKGLISIFLSGFVLATASAQSVEACQTSEASCVLDAAWSAALELPQDKQARLASAFLEVANLADDRSIAEKWAKRFGVENTPSRDAYPDFGWASAEPVIKANGVEGLIQQAKAKQGDLSIGRADALLAAGRKLHADKPDEAKAINAALVDIAMSASDFEKPTLAHAAAELAMIRCDVPALDRALLMTDAPSNLRYAFWRARIEGGALALLTRVRSEASDSDTRHVRQVLDGYRAVLEFGTCGQ